MQCVQPQAFKVSFRVWQQKPSLSCTPAHEFSVLKEYATEFWGLCSIVAKLKRFITVGWSEV